MTYRDICFCHASNDHYCKENNVSKCTNTECMRHASTIPDNLQSGNCLFIRILAANVENTERSEEKRLSVLMMI